MPSCRVIVVDSNRRPVEGARVSLELSHFSCPSLPTVKTDKMGIAKFQWDGNYPACRINVNGDLYSCMIYDGGDAKVVLSY